MFFVRVTPLFSIFALFIVFTAATDSDEHQDNVQWVHRVIELEAKDLLKTNGCANKATEYCADEYAGDWGGSVNCVREFHEYGADCSDVVVSKDGHGRRNNSE